MVINLPYNLSSQVECYHAASLREMDKFECGTAYVRAIWILNDSFYLWEDYDGKEQNCSAQGD